MGYADAISLPRNVWGFLEWMTGVIRVNATVEELQRLVETREHVRLAYEETVTHEFFHCAQICAAGYPHHFASSVAKVLYPILHPYLQAFPSHVDLEHASTRFAQAPPAIPAALVAVLESLDEPGSDGVTPREIVESAAYLVQKRTHRPALDAAGYARTLHLAPAPEYRMAYLAAESILGERAFGLFPALSFHALCFLRPHDVFMDLCRTARAMPDGALPRAAEDLARTHRCLGTAARYARDHANGALNPFYAGHARTLAAIGRWRREDVCTLMSAPYAWMPAFRQRLRIPMILNPDDVASFRVRNGRAEPPGLGMKVQCLAATLCLILLDGELGPHYLRSGSAAEP